MQMQYLLMIYGDEAAAHGTTPEQGKALGEAYSKFTQDIVRSGHLKGGDQVKGSDTATTIRRKGDGKTLTTDGPFAETREQLAGYYIVEAKDLDEALSIANRIPFSEGAVEVRPINTAARMY
jgi:hypothetical protein